MQIIENYAEHPFEFPQKAPDFVKLDDKGNILSTMSEAGAVALRKHAVVIPWRNRDEDGGGPSKVRVHEETLKAMKADPVAKHWFNRNELVVGAEPEDEDERKKIVTAPMPPGLPQGKKETPKAA